MLLSENFPAARTLFRTKPILNSRQDKIMGALLGAAIGDVMGYAIKDMSKEDVHHSFGDWGIAAPPYDSLVSHQFQLILFALDSLIASTQKSLKLSVSEITQCLLKSFKEWEIVINNPKLYFGIKPNSAEINACTDFMKNYPLWKYPRPGNKISKQQIHQIVNPLLIALTICASSKTIKEVAKELIITLGRPEIDVDFASISNKIEISNTSTDELKVESLEQMRLAINESNTPHLVGGIAGFKHGIKFGIQGFKQIWYLRIDAITLTEQMGWRVGRNIRF